MQSIFNDQGHHAQTTNAGKFIVRGWGGQAKEGKKGQGMQWPTVCVDCLCALFVCTLCALFVYTLCALCLHFVCTVWALCALFVFTLCALCLHCLCLLCVHCVCTVCALFV